MHIILLGLLVFLALVIVITIAITSVLEVSSTTRKTQSKPAREPRKAQSQELWRPETLHQKDGSVKMVITQHGVRELIEHIEAGLSVVDLEDRLISAELEAQERADVYNRSIERQERYQRQLRRAK